MNKKILLLLLCAPLCASLSAQSLLGPRNVEMTERGVWAPVAKPVQKAFDNLWAYRLYPAADKKVLRGGGINIAILDSGISSNAEFNGKKVKLQDFTLSGVMTDVKDHGTALAGVIGAKGLQFTGLAPDAKLFIFKIDDGSAMIGPQAVAAALYAVLHYNEENPGDRISVVNLSYGVQSGGFEPISKAIRALYQAGVVVVAPSGNYGFPGVHYPANMPEVIAVGALGADAQSAYPHSSYGPQVEFIAPGDRVFSTANDGNYTLMSGTSISAAFVTAAVALVVEGYVKTNKTYPTVEEVRLVLRAAAKPVEGVAPVKQGYGLIDVSALEKQF